MPCRPKAPVLGIILISRLIQALKEDKNEIFRAAHDASAAADYIVGPHRGQQLHTPSAVRDTAELVARAEPEAGPIAVQRKKTAMSEETRMTNGVSRSRSETGRLHLVMPS
jgi:hypothetical protein